MCNHSYSGDYSRMPRNMGVKCPCPEIYERARARSPSVEVAEPLLPMDLRGVCIFHSVDATWKRDKDFEGEFRRLVQLLNDDPASGLFDFAEFIFLGSRAPGTGKHLLRFGDMGFRKQAYFVCAKFIDPLELQDVDFPDGATFSRASFASDLTVTDCRFNGLNFTDVEVARRARFNKVEFLSFALFGGSTFRGTDSGYVVKIENSRFEGIAEFCRTSFFTGEESVVGFSRVQFEDCADFREANFSCKVDFSDVTFGLTTDFIDTSFNVSRSAARYRGEAVEFNRIEVRAGAVVAFVGTDPQKKLFNQGVQFSFKDDPAGLIRFENVNLSQLTPNSLERINRLAKVGRVEIGSGCIKYRYRTEERTVSVSEGNSSLVTELCQTFSSYFIASNGINLGFEIVARDSSGVSFFYFTDENISEAVFVERLAKAERDLWNLLSINSDDRLVRIQNPESMELAKVKESSFINAVDGVSALLGTFFRVGARIACGAWKEVDTKALLSAMRFNEEGAQERAVSLHEILVERYTGSRLLGFSHDQNKLLVPIRRRLVEAPESNRVKILFLGANSANSPIEIEREVRHIKTSLKLAKERDSLELKQEWAVTVESLVQAMLDEAPTIVHFSGHGVESGIFLQDEIGKPKLISAEALSELFGVFKDTVRCVVLNCCFSEPQAIAIRRHISHVVGVRSRISDSASMAFSTGFYKAIGAGRSVPSAFELGRALLHMNEDGASEGVVVLL